MLATLARQTGSLQLAEDAVQDAAVRALEIWTRDGVPPSPRGWLLLVARRRAVDVLRREAMRARKEAAYVDLILPGGQDDDAVEDDLLRLLFTCCHPALDRSTQIALALKWLCGLSTAQTARLLLVPESAMARRLSRARRKIAVAHIPFRVPPGEDLPERVTAVLATVHLLFTEGYSATGPRPALHDERTGEALRLARLLRALLPDDAGVCGLLALILLHSARTPARTTPDGALVLLAEQDRARWSRAVIQEGVALVGEGLARTPLRPDRYVVQAAIAACHCLARTWQDTDWAAVVSWYDVLTALDPSPIVQLNRAVAVAERDGPAAGLAAVEELQITWVCTATGHPRRAPRPARPDRRGRRRVEPGTGAPAQRRPTPTAATAAHKPLVPRRRRVQHGRVPAHFLASSEAVHTPCWYARPTGPCQQSPWVVRRRRRSPTHLGGWRARRSGEAARPSGNGGRPQGSNRSPRKPNTATGHRTTNTGSGRTPGHAPAVSVPTATQRGPLPAGRTARRPAV